MLYIFGLFEKFAQSSGETAAGTKDIFFRILSWSLLAMWEGFWPSADRRGVPYNRESAEAKFDQYLAIFFISQYHVSYSFFSSENHGKKWTTSRRWLFLIPDCFDKRPGLFCKMARHPCVHQSFQTLHSVERNLLEH